MCDPATMTALFTFASSSAGLTTATVAATAVSAYGLNRQAQGQQAALDYQGQLAEVNAVRADKAARDALERGELSAIEHGRNVAKLRGQQIAKMAGSGVEVGYGSSGDVLGDTDVLGAEDLGRIHENAYREAEGFSVNASNYRAEGAGLKAQSANVRTAAIIDTGSTLLNGATQLGGTWAKYGKPKFR